MIFINTVKHIKNIKGPIIISDTKDGARKDRSFVLKNSLAVICSTAFF